MASVDSLKRQVKQLRAKVDQDYIAKTWCFCLEAGETLPDAVRARIKPQDMVYIREYPRGLLQLEGHQPGQGYCYWGAQRSMQSLVIYPDGRLTKVKKL